MKLVHALLVLPLAAAFAANVASVGVDEAYSGSGPDADEVLPFASLIAAALVAAGVAWRDSRTSDLAGALQLGLVAGLLTFALSWLPLLIAVTGSA